MRSTTPGVHRLTRSRPSPASPAAPDAPPRGASGPCSPRRVVAESERIMRRLQQLEARPWWRVSGRELDELDARLDVLRAVAAGPQRG